MKWAVLRLAACGIVVAVACGCTSQQPAASPTMQASESNVKAQDSPDAASFASNGSATDPANETGEGALSASTGAQVAVAEAGAQAQAIAQASGMDVAVALVDLATGEYAGYQGSKPMVSASMIKLIVAATFLDQVQAGAQSLDATYTLRQSDLVGGTGTLSAQGAGASVTYRELLRKMISVSDNTATNILIDVVGGPSAVNAEAQKLGLYATQLNRRMMDSQATAAGIENYVSADDVALLLRMVHDGTFVDAPSSALVLQALEEQQDNAGIPQGLPTGMPFAHKTGTLATVRHDGGIVEGARPYVLVVLCGGAGFTEHGALAAMAQIADATYGILGK